MHAFLEGWPICSPNWIILIGIIVVEHLLLEQQAPRLLILLFDSFLPLFPHLPLLLRQPGFVQHHLCNLKLDNVTDQVDILVEKMILPTRQLVLRADILEHTVLQLQVIGVQAGPTWVVFGNDHRREGLKILIDPD